MSPDLALDFTRYSLRPGAGVWIGRCRACDREVPLATVKKVLAWQLHHRCAEGNAADAEALAAATRRTAQAMLARITPDPLEDVLRRRSELEDAARAHVCHRAREKAAA